MSHADALTAYGLGLLAAAEFVERAAAAGEEDVLLWLPHALAHGHLFVARPGDRVTAAGIIGPTSFRRIATQARLLPDDLGDATEALYVVWFGAEADGARHFRAMLRQAAAAWPDATHVCARRRGRRVIRTIRQHLAVPADTLTHQEATNV